MTRTITTLALLAAVAATTNAQELTSNGGFEAGDTSDWVSFPTANSTFSVTNDAASGTFAGTVFNNDLASAHVIKQANLGIGLVQPGDEIQISFKAKGDFVVGGVLFAEFFSELDGGGTSKSEILSGGPLFVAPESNYQMFSFTTTAGPDVSGGVTLQFAIATGGATGSTAVAFIDDVSVFRVPAPGATALLGMGGLLAMRRRR